jgi:hypothetical protein
MPGFVLHQGATVLCAHAGQAMPTAPNPRVRVAGQPVVTLASPYTVAGCALPPAAGGPCVTAQFVMGAVRVRVAGQPVLLQDSLSMCAPTGTPLSVLMAQIRVKAM